MHFKAHRSIVNKLAVAALVTILFTSVSCRTVDKPAATSLASSTGDLVNGYAAFFHSYHRAFKGARFNADDFTVQERAGGWTQVCYDEESLCDLVRRGSDQGFESFFITESKKLLPKQPLLVFGQAKAGKFPDDYLSLYLDRTTESFAVTALDTDTLADALRIVTGYSKYVIPSVRVIAADNTDSASASWKPGYYVDHSRGQALTSLPLLKQEPGVKMMVEGFARMEKEHCDGFVTSVMRNPKAENTLGRLCPWKGVVFMILIPQKDGAWELLKPEIARGPGMQWR